MKSIVKKTYLTNHLLKFVSLIFGYFFWLILVQTQKINIVSKIPLCFYNVPANLEINAAENINVIISGTRNDLSFMNLSKDVAIHIDASKFICGDLKIKLTNDDIFLHHKIKLVDFNPSLVSLQIKEKK